MNGNRLIYAHTNDGDFKMDKWTEEKILYFASKDRGFELDKEAITQKALRDTVETMKSNGLLKKKSSSMFKTVWRATDEGLDKLLEYQQAYRSSKQSKLEKNTVDTCIKDGRNYHVYFGRDKNDKLVYIGTTIQEPEARWRWHRNNGKNLRFEIHKTFDNKNDMLLLEFELIKLYKPKLNKITGRPQNLNVKLTKNELESRKGNKEWCQSCLKRRAKNGDYCGHC